MRSRRLRIVSVQLVRFETSGSGIPAALIMEAPSLGPAETGDSTRRVSERDLRTTRQVALRLLARFRPIFT
jgi:hypothetical protein